LAIERVQVWILYATILFASAVGLVLLFFTIFQCSPVNYFWNKGTGTGTGTCIDKNLLINIGYFYSASAAITDLTLALVPVAFVWNLRMGRRSKSAVVGILCIGCMFVVQNSFNLCSLHTGLIIFHSASVAVIVRIPFLHHYKDRDFLCTASISKQAGRISLTALADNTYQVGIWSYIEAGLGITAASLATLRPLGRLFRAKASTLRHDSHSCGSFPLSREWPHEQRVFTLKRTLKRKSTSSAEAEAALEVTKM
jgi:hypothetical protein